MSKGVFAWAQRESEAKAGGSHDLTVATSRQLS